MTATMRRRLPVPRGDRALRLGRALLAAALLWLPLRHAGADAASPPAEAVPPATAESGAMDSSKVVRQMDRRWRLKTFFADSIPSKAEPERQSSK